jgi:hypothetical protein
MSGSTGRASGGYWPNVGCPLASLTMGIVKSSPSLRAFQGYQTLGGLLQKKKKLVYHSQSPSWNPRHNVRAVRGDLQTYNCGELMFALKYQQKVP